MTGVAPGECQQMGFSKGVGPKGFAPGRLHKGGRTMGVFSKWVLAREFDQELRTKRFLH